MAQYRLTHEVPPRILSLRSCNIRVRTMLNHVLVGLLLAFSLQLSSHEADAQGREKKGYIAVSAGPSFLPGDYYDESAGLQLTLLEFGYEFGHRLGVSVSWVGASFLFDSPYTVSSPSSPPVTGTAHMQLAYGILAAGPMYSIRTGSRSSIDLKARIGRYVFDEKIDDGASFNSTSTTASVGYLISATYQKRLSTWWTFLVSLDYGLGRHAVSMDSYEHIHSLAPTVGIGLRL
jgi:hypothetical protein